MPTWLGVILTLGAIFGVGWLWETIKERGGKAGKAAEVAGNVVEKTENIISLIVIKGAGLVFVILGVVSIVFMFTDFRAWQLLGLLLLGYGIYLLLPGEKWFFISF